MTTSNPVTIAHPYIDVFRATVDVLPQHKFEVTGMDEAGGVINAKAGMSMRSWGENITVRLGSPDGGATTTVVIESKLRMGVVGWGKNDKNIAEITEAIRSALPSLPPPAPSPDSQPPPPAPPAQP